MVAPAVNLLDLNRSELAAFFDSLDEPPTRATHVLQAIHRDGLANIDDMRMLNQGLRQRLAACAEIKLPEITSDHTSQDGTRKWLVRLHDGLCIETVYIPEAERGTLCVSSQVGCALNCDFCATGAQGFNRNLQVSEIIGQVWLAVRALSQQQGRHDHHITNIVMMGMGEPLLNFDNLVQALDIMMDDYAYGLSKHRVTVSTAGVVPAMKRLSQASPVSIAVSLHAPNDAIRTPLVPLNKKYPIAVLLAACRDYFPAPSKRTILIEYTLMDGVNDRPAHAEELAKLLSDLPVKVNLIPFNPFPGSHYRCASQAAIDEFHAILMQAGINTTTRKTRGEDINAACGQLIGDFQDRTRRRLQNASARPA